MNRCRWAQKTPEEQHYHDNEWGVPLHDEQRLFEFLLLEGMQAGLSWITILRKRENYRQALDGFDPHKIVHYDDAKLAELLANPGIIRNRLKVHATVRNAQAFLAVQEQEGSFDRFIWQFTGGDVLQPRRASFTEVPATTPESDAMSKALKKRGFTFVGSTICYAFMQAVGMVNDHTVDCFRHAELCKGH